MKTSDNGVALIKRFEGLELEAYQDIAGVWTIAYGFTGYYPDWLRFPAHRLTDRVGPGHAVTEAEAGRLLTDALASREAALVGWRVTNGVDLNQNEFDALISFIFNVGFAAFKGSTAARWLREGKPRAQVAEALTWWNKATVNGKLQAVKGLTDRRRSEWRQFLTDIDEYPPYRAPYASHHFAHLIAIDHRESNAAPAKEQRPIRTYFPAFHEECNR